ncbi:SCO2522 family protein [Cryptosporangium phraense]|uniref:Uncharacterized protein n=1 Tax=Cryptosporangium phraense TaxID=2593070 RepID=A0A545AMK8_9ACTN|nr:SCO2522 family protein [Cryptosporangium phraense]TQS42574.1 hypothetical protein FL583_23045 [Cryptosporangium phraense]
MAVETTFGETTGRRRVAAVPLSHLSVQLAYLDFDDLLKGPRYLSDRFARAAPWAETARRVYGDDTRGRPRWSTCVVLDDYFGNPPHGPAEVLPELIGAAESVGLQIDYVARQSACVRADGVDVAELVRARLVPEPLFDTTGSRPPVDWSGWLSNGQRSATDFADAMPAAPREWVPPRQTTARDHSIFLDVELWRDEPSGQRLWSLAFLTAVWQLLRLGLLRNNGAPIAVPVDVEQPLPDDWPDLPPIVQLNSSAAPFAAYRTLSVLNARTETVGVAARMILGQISIDTAVQQQIVQRSSAEGISLTAEVTGRINYVLDSGF